MVPTEEYQSTKANVRSLYAELKKSLDDETLLKLIDLADARLEMEIVGRDYWIKYGYEKGCRTAINVLCAEKKCIKSASEIQKQRDSYF